MTQSAIPHSALRAPQSIVGIHLDLKYQMPNKVYLLEWLERLPEFGINTILLEYEDEFPFMKYPFLRAEGAFTAEELTAFLDRARTLGLRVIPLVQTLAHLEFALAHGPLAHLRETEEIPHQICPSNPEAVAFVHDLLEEVLAFHEADEWFHLGADEAWSLGACERCAGRVKSGGGAVALWMEHTTGMCDFVRARGKRPLVWDDAFWPDPSRVVDFPDDVILCTWHYGTAQIKPESTAARCAEAYAKAGRDFIGVPCANWGVLFPRHRCLENTAGLVDLVKSRPSLGLINSAWSCFHLPWPTFLMQVAATGAMMTGTTEAVDEAWEQTFFDREFGAHIDGLSAALADLGKLWEIKIEGRERPITPMVHGCMDMILHYPGGQRERMKQGAYPLDWSVIDFRGLYRQKIELLRALPAEHSFHGELTDYLSRYEQAAGTVRALPDASTRHVEEARLFAALAEFKLQATRAVSSHLRGEPGRMKVLTAVEGCRAPLDSALAPFLEPVSVERMLRMWHDPVAAALR